MFTKTDKQKSSRQLPELEITISEESHKNEAIDGGWGWVVVFSSLLLNILLDGIGLSYGVLLPKFAEYFQAPKSTVSLIGSILIGTYMISGPFVSGLVNKFGCRLVAIIGSIISATGIILGSFSTSLEILIVTYGFIGGVGFGMMYLSSIVSVGIYFDKKRPIATGIAVCGSGIGTFIFSPVLEFLSEIYDWKNVLIIIGGIVLNGAVFGMLIRPLKNRKATATITKSNANNQPLIYEKQTHSATEIQNDDYTTFIYEESQPFLEVDKSSTLQLTSNGKSKSLNDIVVPNLSHDTQNTQSKLTNQHLISGPLHKSLPNIKQPDELSISESGDLSANSAGCECIPPYIMEIFDFTLLLNLPFMLVCFGNLFSAGAYYLSFMYLVDSALLLGISSTKAALLLSVIGITNTVGRILAGLLANMKHVDALVVNNIALVIASIMLFVQPFCTTYPSLVIFGLIYGLSIAAYVSLTSIILCDILGVEKLSNAFGFLGITRGIASVVGPLSAGIVYQSTGSYDFSFYLGGLLFLLGAIFHLMLHLPCIKPSTVK